MGLRFWYSILFGLICAATIGVQGADREVQIEWEAEEGTKQYEIEISKPNGEKVKTQKFKTNDFTFRLPTGKFLIKCRPFDKRYVAGPWSDPFEIEVPPPSVEFIKLPVDKLAASSKTLKATVPLSWTSAEDIEQYRVKIFNSRDELIEEKVTADSKWDFEAPPGKYRAELVGLSKEGLENPEKSLQSFEVDGAQMDDLVILDFDPKVPNQVKWSGAAEGANFKGTLERQDLAADELEEWDVIKTFEQQKEFLTETSMPLKAGAYRLTVEASAEGFKSPPKAQREFIVKPPLRELSSVPEETNTQFDFSKISN